MNEEQPGGSPWVKTLAIWGSIALVLALLITVFNPRGDAAATQLSYSDFLAKVQAGDVASVQVGETKNPRQVQGRQAVRHHPDPQ